MISGTVLSLHGGVLYLSLSLHLSCPLLSSSYIPSPLARRSLLSSALASSFYLEFSFPLPLSFFLSPARARARASLSRGFTPLLYRGVPRQLGSGSCVHPSRLYHDSFRPSFLPPARERSSPSGSKPKNPGKTLLSRLDISRQPATSPTTTGDRRHLRYFVRNAKYILAKALDLLVFSRSGSFRKNAEQFSRIPVASSPWKLSYG